MRLNAAFFVGSMDLKKLVIFFTLLDALMQRV